MSALLLAAALMLVPSERPVVAVLYFDNNTGQQDLDVLRKGFADMMVTDLAGAEGLRVVEREKLQAIIDELKLQRTSYFDASTAQKLGKALGATHVVTGAFAAMEPQMRVDVRLIDIATTTVVLGEQVVGEKQKVFDLEQALVKRFLAALDVKLGGAARPSTKAAYGAVVAYSRALDASDSGKLDDAKIALASVVKSAPEFGLAKRRLLDIVERLQRANARRGSAIEKLVEDMRTRADGYLRTHSVDTDPQPDARIFVAYRHLAAMGIQWNLRKLLAPGYPALVVEGHELEAEALLEAYVGALRDYITDRDVYALRFAQMRTPWQLAIESSFPAPPQETRAIKAAKIDDAPGGHEAERRYAELLLNGRMRGAGEDPVMLWPPPAVRNPAFLDEGLKRIKALIAWGDARYEEQGNLEFLGWMPREVLAEHLVSSGKRDEAITLWQDYLEKYPESGRFKFIEDTVREMSGLARRKPYADLDAYPQALKTCDDMPIRKALDDVIRARMFTLGWDAIPTTVQELEKACVDAKRKSTIQYVYSHTALDGARRKNCRIFDAYMAKYLDAGGSKVDEAGYRRNYAPDCQQHDGGVPSDEN